ncbi:hypothetical protein SAMN05444395_1045 [Flavobacterium fryxellicola]|uniref:Uncharacterized protein n=1 Tax=Flavobacterium fryxellicola TaxID=249352 RepID=A0A167WFT5_9FLAO|nr:hypothetical protein FBFR_12450 [Flavobacterium fryxellicola]SHN66662.1 hypothetical protein SAMN05444395_1045 [Flavobacterium fryxellicola]
MLAKAWKNTYQFSKNFKKTGKITGCITTVLIKHPTPAIFFIFYKNKNSRDTIPIMHLDLKFIP